MLLKLQICLGAVMHDSQVYVKHSALRQTFKVNLAWVNFNIGRPLIQVLDYLKQRDTHLATQ